MAWAAGTLAVGTVAEVGTSVVEIAEETGIAAEGMAAWTNMGCVVSAADSGAQVAGKDHMAVVVIDVSAELLMHLAFALVAAPVLPSCCCKDFQYQHW